MVRNLLQKREGGFRPDPKFVYKWPTVILDWRYPDMCRKIQQTNSTASQIFWWWDEGKGGCCWLLLTTNGQQAIIARQKPMWERRSHAKPYFTSISKPRRCHHFSSKLVQPCHISHPPLSYPATLQCSSSFVMSRLWIVTKIELLLRFCGNSVD